MKRVLKLVAVVTVAFVVAGVASPARAAGGLFEVLFGGGQTHYAPAPPPAFAPLASAPIKWDAGKSAQTRTPRKRTHTRYTKINGHRVLASAPLPPQRPSDLAVGGPPIMSAQEAIANVLHDETLRPGDAYMAEDGLRVFVGFSGADHDKAVFVDLVAARHIAPSHKARLAAVDTPLRRYASAAPSPSHRSLSIHGTRHRAAVRNLPSRQVSPWAARLREALSSDYFVKPVRFAGRRDG